MDIVRPGVSLLIPPPIRCRIQRSSRSIRQTSPGSRRARSKQPVLMNESSSISILCKKNLTLDGSHPALYEGYGAYGISYDPYFDPRTLAWIERGGVFAIVHCRGGGEFGESWHNAGQKETKQHTIDDMVPAAHTSSSNAIRRPDISPCAAPAPEASQSAAPSCSIRSYSLPLSTMLA